MNSKLSTEVQNSVGILRALLNMHKNPIKVSSLLYEYREMEGRPLPYKNYGFQTPEEFLKASEEFLLINDKKEIYICALPNKDSAHIVKMVASQKTSSKKRRRVQALRYVNNAQLLRNLKSVNNVSNQVKSVHKTFSDSNNNKTEIGYRLDRNSSDKNSKKSSSSNKLNENLKISNDKNSSHVQTSSMRNVSYCKENIITVQINNSKGSNNSICKKNSFIAEKYVFDSKLDAITSLKNYCLALGYPEPEYTLKRYSVLICYVTVNGKKYTTYPQNFKSFEIAKMAVAEIAIKEIVMEQLKFVSYTICKDSDSDLLLKIYEEIKDHHIYGIFKKNFPMVFEKKFEAVLPEHWFLLVENSNLFELIPTADNQDIIIYVKLDSTETDYLIPEQDELEINDLQLPWNEIFWEICITHCVSTTEIWAQILGEEFNHQLKQFSNIDIVTLADKNSLIIGDIYLVNVQESWYRVRLEDYDKITGMCACVFIDFGNGEWLSIDELHICDEKYLKLPPQAIQFTLVGLEDFAENSIANCCLYEVLMDKVISAKILTKKENYENESLNDSLKIKTVLFDKTSSIEVNLNKLLITKICDDIPKPRLKENLPINVQITHVADNGEFYLQILDSEMFYIEKWISQVVESKIPKIQHNVESNDIKLSTYYLIYDEGDDKWYRGCLTENNDHTKHKIFEMFFIDYGITKEVNISYIFNLELLSTILSKYPKQSLKVKMHNLPPLNEFLLEKMKSLLLRNSKAIVKLAINQLDTSSKIIPPIIAFVRIEGNQSLCNVNEAIRMEYELMSSINDLEACEISENGNSFSINSSHSNLNTKVSLPQKGEVFTVLVTEVTDPFNFFVQSCTNSSQFDNMTEELQNYYKNHERLICNNNVEINKIYAAPFEDGLFYRCIIENILSNGQCGVNFCDLGHKNDIEIILLRTLPDQFRELPVQAMQAKLYGVIPVKEKWSSQDNERFQQLTYAKKFSAFVTNISKTKILELKLFNDQDTPIHETLVIENHAIFDN